MKEGNFVPKDTSFDALVGGWAPGPPPFPRPVLYLLPAPRPLLSPEGALLLFRPQEGLYRYRNAAGFLLPEPDPELLAFAEREGLGFALYPPGSSGKAWSGPSPSASSPWPPGWPWRGYWTSS